MREKARVIHSHRRLACLGAVAALGMLCLAAPVGAFEVPLQVPAVHSERLLQGPLLAVAKAGSRLVAVGPRGAIVTSDDQGGHWLQAEVPVSVDLVAVTFVDERQGWAVGHGGVVLHSADGGRTWRKQLDGHQASRLALDFYQGAEQYLAREERLAQDNETQPFLDVHFQDARHGYVVGTFNRIFMTRDGGTTWQPQMHLTGNDQEWHFYAVDGRGGQLYLAGEQGHVWSKGAGDERFQSIDTPYNGTLFGVTAAADGLLYAYGMRGSLFRSEDRGARWQRVTLPIGSNVMRLLDLGAQRLLAVGQGGELALSADAGRSFAAVGASAPVPYFGAALLERQRVALASAIGVRVEGF